MANVILDISKYLIIFLVVIFTVITYYGVIVGGDERKLTGKLQIACVYALQFIGNLVLGLKTSDGKVIAFYFMQFALLSIYRIAFLKLHEKASEMLLNIVCMLFTIGFIIIMRLDAGLAYRQFFMVFIGVVISLAIPYIVKYFKSEDIVSILCALAGITGLLLVLFLADTDRGAKLAINIGKISFQASEFVKITFVIMCAELFQDKKNGRKIVLGTFLAFIHILILVLSKDLGMALILALTYMLMLFISLSNYAVLLLGGIGVIVFAFPAYHFFSHVQTRIDVWLDPWKDVLGDGWQIIQSLFAIGTGGWTGSGLYNGSPDSIPIVTTDFIFSAVSEEMGGIVAVCIILIYLAFVLKMLMMASAHKSDYVKMMLAGFACIIAVQVILNTGGVIKFIPMTGLTLPLISYGGSSVISTFIMFGFIQGISNIKLRKI